MIPPQTSPHHLHHDGHPQRVFSDVIFAFLARGAAAFGVFRLVQLLLLVFRHSRVDRGMKQSEEAVKSNFLPATQEEQPAKPACLHRQGHARGGLTLNGFSNTNISPLVIFC